MSLTLGALVEKTGGELTGIQYRDDVKEIKRGCIVLLVARPLHGA